MNSVSLVSHKCVVRKSPVHGYGVFASQDIKANEIIEECYTLSVKTQAERLLIDYIFKVKDNKYFGVVLGNGSIYNHSDTPNAEYDYDAERAVMIFSAKKDIKCGQEIFTSYGDNWFATRQCLPKPLTFKAKLKRLTPAFLKLLRVVIVLGICLSVVMVLQ